MLYFTFPVSNMKTKTVKVQIFIQKWCCH